MKINRKRLILGALIVIIALTAFKLWRIGRPAWRLYNTYTQAREIAADPAAPDVSLAQPMIHQSYLDLAALQSELRPFYGLMRRLHWLPKIGGDVAAAPELLAMGVSFAELGDTLAGVFEPVLPLLADRENLSGGSEELLAAAVAAMADSSADFERARQSFDAAMTQRAAIDADSLSPKTANLVNRLDSVLPLAQLALDFVPVAADLLGAEQSRTYLVVAQNDDELRATGGFLSSVGTLTLDGGKVITLTFEDSYAIDDYSQSYPEPPPPLTRYMAAPIWVFRDANWSPDYPASVQAMLDLYHISRDTELDGVIVIDQVALQRIVAALEPLTVPGWDEAVTGKNVIRLIRESWSPDDPEFSGWNAEWWQNRKNFVSNLVAAMRGRVEESPKSVDWRKLIEASLQILDERHAQIWFANGAAQQVIEAQGWDGAIRPAEGDYLMVVDANLGFNKVNAVAETSLQYRVDLSSLQMPTAVLTVTHRNNSRGTSPCNPNPRYGKDYNEIINRCYWNYLRVYTPLGSELLQAAPHAIPGEFVLGGRDEPARVVEWPAEAGKSVWGTFLLVPNGQKVETSFQYTLPVTITRETDEGWRYHLLLQKQAGTVNNQARVTLQLPPNSQLLKAIPAPDRTVEDGCLEFEFTLLTDRELEVIFE